MAHLEERCSRVPRIVECSSQKFLHSVTDKILLWLFEQTQDISAIRRKQYKSSYTRCFMEYSWEEFGIQWPKKCNSNSSTSYKKWHECKENETRIAFRIFQRSVTRHVIALRSLVTCARKKNAESLPKLKFLLPRRPASPWPRIPAEKSSETLAVEQNCLRLTDKLIQFLWHCRNK